MFELTTDNVIKLTLLHPFQSIPVRSWAFKQEPIIRIGRSMKNHVVLYSAVVSRHHVELRQFARGWKVFNLGTNGTYIEGVQVSESWVKNGCVIHLAISGPKIQLNIDPHPSNSQPLDDSLDQSEPLVKVRDPYEIKTQITTASPSHPNALNLPQTYEEITEVDPCD
ncbi:MAG: FHA domain-containing protein [Microcoleaceae cyanobacterium]